MRPSRLVVLADSSGRLLAAWMVETQTEGAPQVLVIAGEKQIVREVELPQELQDTPLHPEILERYRLKQRDEGGELVRAPGSRG